jgi:hypothetical protein
MSKPLREFYSPHASDLDAVIEAQRWRIDKLTAELAHANQQIADLQAVIADAIRTASLEQQLQASVTMFRKG